MDANRWNEILSEMAYYRKANADPAPTPWHWWTFTSPPGAWPGGDPENFSHPDKGSGAAKNVATKGTLGAVSFGSGSAVQFKAGATHGYAEIGTTMPEVYGVADGITIVVAGKPASTDSGTFYAVHYRKENVDKWIQYSLGCINVNSGYPHASSDQWNFTYTDVDQNDNRYVAEQEIAVDVWQVVSIQYTYGDGDSMRMTINGKEVGGWQAYDGNKGLGTESGIVFDDGTLWSSNANPNNPFTNGVGGDVKMWKEKLTDVATDAVVSSLMEKFGVT